MLLPSQPSINEHHREHHLDFLKCHQRSPDDISLPCQISPETCTQTTHALDTAESAMVEKSINKYPITSHSQLHSTAPSAPKQLRTTKPQHPTPPTSTLASSSSTLHLHRLSAHDTPHDPTTDRTDDFPTPKALVSAIGTVDTGGPHPGSTID